MDKSGKKILIVDDEYHIRHLLDQTLEVFEDKGVSIHMAGNGLEGLEIIKEIKPDLVYLDLVMPKMNGFELCNEIKNVLKMKDIYIIMLTAKGQEIDRQKCLEVGTDIYMTKPFDPDTIVKTTEKVLGIRLEAGLQYRY